jgi:hypothetical protein
MSRHTWQHQESVALARHHPSSGHGRFVCKRTLPLDREQISKTLGVCGWVLAGSGAMLAIWELGNFRTLLNSDPPRPAIHQLNPPATYRPAGESGGGCTQAPIDRASGQTMPADCHTMMAPGDSSRAA